MAEVRCFAAAGLRFTLEDDLGCAGPWPTPALAVPEAAARGAELRVRVRAFAPGEAPRARRDRLTARFTSREVVMTDAFGGHVRQRLHADAGLAGAELTCAPDAGASLPSPRLDAIAFAHRLVREGAVPFEACVTIRDGAALVFVGAGPSVRGAWSRLLAHAGGTVLHGPVALRGGPGGALIVATPWVRVVRGTPVRRARVHTVHVVRPATQVLAEPLVGRAAVEALAASAALLREDREGLALLRAGLGLLVPELRVVRMASPCDARVRGPALGCPSVPRASADPRPAGG